MPVIGFLAISSRDTYGYQVDAFRQGLSEKQTSCRTGPWRRRLPLDARALALGFL